MHWIQKFENLEPENVGFLGGISSSNIIFLIIRIVADLFFVYNLLQ